MKTVMKKMFCLMLVAVLMVGVMPFQAFAATDVTVNLITVSGGPTIDSFTATVDETLDPASFSSAVQALAEARWGAHYDFAAASDSVKDGNQVYARMTAKVCTKAVDCPAPVDHYSTCGTNCTGAFGCGTETHKSGCQSQYACPSCGAVGEHLNENCPTLFCACGSSLASGLHTDACVENCTMDRRCTSQNHKTDCQGHLCDTDNCTIEESVAHTEHTGAPCSDSHCQKYLGHSGKHSYLCPEPGCDKPIHTGEHSLACSAANCALKLGHAGEHKCACGLYLQKSSSHNASCPFYEAVVINNPNNNYSLNVWAKLWVGETLNKTILLDTITDLSGNDVVAYVIGNNVSRLQSKFPSGYNNIEWTKAVYFDIDSKTTGTVDTKMKVSEEGNVFINLYSTEKLVVVRVHTGKTYNVDRSVQVGGFRVGETVTYNDVLKAVQKYYNVSTMKMYTYGEWEKVVNGGNGATTPNFIVKGGEYDNVYEVYLTGSAKTSTTASNKKADSTNPKTGDEIFVPMTVLFASVSSLAVLYYLNKKRAI